MKITDRVVVPFDGAGAGVDELAWGQRGIWATMIRQNSWLPMGGSKDLPPGTTVDDVAGELSYLMGRFPSMRTRLRFDAGGHVVQVVSGRGEIELEIIDAADADNPRHVADETCHRFHRTPYDFVTQWPVRMAVVRHRGALTHMVVIMCHLVADGAGAVMMQSEVAVRPSTPITGMQSLEQARWQRSPAGRRQHETAARHWESVLRAVPRSPAPGSTERREPRHWTGALRSSALDHAVRIVAERLRVDTAPVLLAAYGVAVARITGAGPLPVLVMVSNRFRPGLADVVSMVAQNGLCLLDVADVPFDEAVTRTRRASMAAYKHAYYDPARMAALIEDVAGERGFDVDLNRYYNDRRAVTRAEPGAPPTPRQWREALAGTVFEWTAARHDPAESLMVHVDDAEDGLRLTVFIDTHVVAPGDAETLVRTMEEVVVAAARADHAATTTAVQTASGRRPTVSRSPRSSR